MLKTKTLKDCNQINAINTKFVFNSTFKNFLFTKNKNVYNIFCINILLAFHNL